MKPYIPMHLVFALALALVASVAPAAVVVSEFGATAPTDIATGYTGAANAEFGWDAGETVGQTFTLTEAITLKSIFIAYRSFTADATFTVRVDAGRNGTFDIEETGIVLDASDFNGTTATTWMQWDLSSHNLTLTANTTHEFIMTITAETGGSFALAPKYNSGNVYAGGGETSNVVSGGDFLFAISAVVIPAPAALPAGLALMAMTAVRRRR